MNHLPFYYAYRTRYRDSLLFMSVFEWVPALSICLLFGSQGWMLDFFKYLHCYAAFICLYEIGYIVNDHVSVRYEANPRKRDESSDSGGKVWTWAATRLAVYSVLYSFVPEAETGRWLAFHLFLAVAFTLHNVLTKSSYKCCTFYALSVCRFLSAAFFVVAPEFLESLFIATLLFYSNFRVLAYMDSKGVLSTPSRKEPGFRTFFFALPLPLTFVISGGFKFEPLFLLNCYFLVAAAADQIRQRFSSPRDIRHR